MSTIRLSEAVWRSVQSHLFSSLGEHFVFVLAECCQSSNGPVFLAKAVHCVPDEHVKRGRDGWGMAPAGFLPAVNAAVRSNAALIECHNHGGRRPGFSPTDRAELPEFVRYVLKSLPGRCYAATVWGDATVYGEFFSPNGTSSPIRSITVGGEVLQQIISRSDTLPLETASSRQIPWFTEEGQRRLGCIRAAVVGAGGTGSHLVQQLVYLGVRDFVLVDNDIADETSMNRLVTATAADIETPKTMLARRLIKSVAPSVNVRIMGQLQSREALEALKEVDVLFGCVDNDGARLILNELARAYDLLYIDLASGINVDDDGSISAAGGRVAVVTPGGPCLTVSGRSMPKKRGTTSALRKNAPTNPAGYVHGIDVPSPSVVSLNAAVASAAINELAVILSGLRPLNVFTELEVLGTGHQHKGQWMVPRRVAANPDCVACSASGQGDRVHIERYIHPAYERR